MAFWIKLIILTGCKIHTLRGNDISLTGSGMKGLMLLSIVPSRTLCKSKSVQLLFQSFFLDGLYQISTGTG